MGVASVEAGVKIPTLGTFADCCALAGTGAANVAPRSAMNSRRLIRFPQGRGYGLTISGPWEHVHRNKKRAPHVRVGSIASFRARSRLDRFTPMNGRFWP